MQKSAPVRAPTVRYNTFDSVDQAQTPIEQDDPDGYRAVRFETRHTPRH
jgi:hypothetical protein